MQKTIIKKKYMGANLSAFWCFLNKHINFKMGVLAGVVTGSVVFAINIAHGFWPAFASFAKQFAFNLIMAGYNTRWCEKLAKQISNEFWSLLAASVVPTLMAFTILYGIHYFGGTPKPMASTVWQVPFNLVIFMFFALLYREKIHIKSPSVLKMSKIFKINPLKPVAKINARLKRKREAS